MSKTYIPAGYRPTMTLYDTQDAIALIKRNFQDSLARALRLKRVTAPLFVVPESGLNDNLNGVERPVRFDIPSAGCDAEVVHSLAKWKRMALYRYDFRPGKGLYTDMNAIRRDETLDNLHSVYVDQWDWEKVLTPETRNQETLHSTVRAIVGCVCDTMDAVRARYPHLNTELCREVTFVSTQALEDRYPELSPKEREHAITRNSAPCSSRASGISSRAACPMTAARRTMTTGLSMGISCFTTPCWIAPWRSPPWAFGWTRSPWTPS